jgi:rhomboid family GlyGly-CTERM serine protease
MGLHQASGTAEQSILRRSTDWRVPLAVAALSVAAGIAGPSARILLRYHRSAIADGELWRLASGHFAHLGVGHLTLNVAGLALVWLLIGSAYGVLGWIFVMALSIAVIDIGFWFLDPELEWYVGMSGLLHGMLAAGILNRLREAPVESTALCALIVGKITYEQLAGPLPGSEASTGGFVVVNAHLYGAIAGVLGAGLLRIRATL